MSLGDAKTFSKLLQNDPALFQTLYTGTANLETFLSRAMAAAKERALAFEPAELVQAMRADLEASRGDLSDGQLDGVAGGITGSGYNTGGSIFESLLGIGAFP